MSVSQKPFPKESSNIRRVSSPKPIPQRFVKDSPTCKFEKNHSSKIRQRVSSPNTIRQRFANVPIRQQPFTKDSQTTIHQRFANVSVCEKTFGNDFPTCQFVENNSPKIRCFSSTKTIRQRFTNASFRQTPFAKYSASCQFPKNHSPKIRQCVCSD